MNAIIFHVWVTVAVILAVTYGALEANHRDSTAAVVENILGGWCILGLLLLVAAL